MPDIVLNTSLTIANGPSVLVVRSLAVDAYDVIEVVIAAGAADKEVQIQPGGTGQVSLLSVSADWFGEALTYKTATGTGATAYALDQPHLFAGAGALATLGTAPPTKLFFSNSTSGVTAKDAKVQVLVGRKATV